MFKLLIDSISLPVLGVFALVLSCGVMFFAQHVVELLESTGIGKVFLALAAAGMSIFVFWILQDLGAF
jgi:hypothetical protein